MANELIKPNSSGAITGIQKLLDSFYASLAPTTRAAYGGDLEDFSRFATGELEPNVGAACEEFISMEHGPANLVALDWRTDMINKKLAPTTINRRLAALRSLVSLANRIGRTTWTLSVGGLKSTPYRDTSGPSVEDFRAILKKARQQTPEKAARDVAILRICFSNALRRSEVYSLDLEHFDFKRGTVSIMGKGRRERETLKIPPKALEALVHWTEYRGYAPGPLFPSMHRAKCFKGGQLTPKGFYWIIVQLGARAGIKIHPHGLRHAGITQAAIKSTDPYAVQEFARHSDMKTTMLYIHRTKDIQGAVATSVEEDV